nr:MAG TPA: hypothetical protein [Caudoviricetes sp.]
MKKIEVILLIIISKFFFTLVFAGYILSSS